MKLQVLMPMLDLLMPLWTFKFKKSSARATGFYAAYTTVYYRWFTRLGFAPRAN